MNRENRVDQREKPAEEHCHEEPDDPAPAPDGAPDTEEGPCQHHAFEPDVHDARALGEDPAHGGEGERRREAQGRGQDSGSEDAVQRRRVLPLQPGSPDRAGNAEADRPPAELPLAARNDGRPARDCEDARREGSADSAHGPRRQGEPERKNAPCDPELRDRARLGQPPDALGGVRRPRLGAHGLTSGWTRRPSPTKRRARQRYRMRRSAPTKKMTSAWIIVARSTARAGSKTSGSSCRVEVPTSRPAKRSAAKRIPTGLFRPSRATAMPVKGMKFVAKSPVETANLNPRRSTEPASPANAPEIASARK